MTDPVKEDLTSNIIFFRDVQGKAHTILFDSIITFSFARYRYYLSYLKPNNGGYSYCYLDDDDFTNYVIYHGKVYTNLDFKKLILVINNENTERMIDELD